MGCGMGSAAGAIDVVAVRDSSGVLSCSPFHVKLNKDAKRGDSCRRVKLTVNSKDVALSMKLGGAGEAFFVERTNQKISQNQSKLPTACPTPSEHNEPPITVVLHESLTDVKTSNAPASSSKIDPNKAEISEVRRRQRSFSDGDIDGDYNFLLDEQLMRAFSLCAPVSFHDEVLNERDKEVAKRISPFKAEEAMGDVVSANIITEARKIGAKVPYESLHLSLGADAEPDGSNIVKLTTSLLACEEISDSNHHLTSRNVGDEYFHAEEEWDKFKVRETGSPRRARALSDLSIIESRAGCFQQKNWGKESSPLVNSLTMDSRPSCAVILNVADRPILPRAPHQESATQGNTISLIPPCNPHAAKIDQVALSAVVGDKVLEEVTTPPSWSWTWGSLPVKSKNKISCTDLSHPTDMGSKCSAPVTSSTINLAPDSAFSLSATEDIPISNLLPSNTGQEYSCDSHSITVFDTLDANTSQSMAEIATNDTKDIIVVEVRDPLDTGAGVDADINGAREMRDHHVKDSLCEDTSRPASIPLYVGGASASKTDDIIQLNIMEAKPDETIGMKIEETIGTATDADADKALNFKWGHSLAEFSQATFGLYRPNINLGNRDKPHADGSQPDLLKAFVKGDPSHADMWRWDALSESEIGGADKMGGGGRGGVEGVRIVRGSLPLSQSTDRRSVQRVPEAGVNNNNTSEKFDPSKDSAACTIGKQQGVAGSEKEVEIDGDGDTDQELDTFSLHDIPLDMISPEPAGGDFYDSDTESYLSLSLDDGESGKNDFKKPRKYRYRRVLVPSQDQLRSLDLNDGENEVTFELQSQEIKRGYAGIIPPLHTQLFVWPPDAKIVVIDIEGAITAVSKGSKGWGMGGFLSVPRTAVHNGVIKLLTNIHRNGYRILYIAQSISTTSGTKEHLAKIAASSDIKLPPGPVFQSPDSLIRAFGPTRTDVFKAAALRGLKSLFPNGHNPFYACFGSNPCDMIAFSRCGVPEGRIYIVSPDTGEVRGMNRTFRSSYEQVNALIHEMFPAVSDCQTRSPRSASSLSPFSPISSPISASASAFAYSTAFSQPPSVSGKDANTCMSSSKSAAESVCSQGQGQADDNYSDFNFWKIPHVPISN